MDKWRVQLESAHQKGPGSTSREVYDCGGDASTGGEVLLWQF